MTRFIGALKRFPWRKVLPVMTLPMLGLAGSYGVYRFALLFFPYEVAITQAAAWECSYIGLALVDNLSKPQRGRAINISRGAVFVSILYNSLDGLFHRRPDLLIAPPLWADVILAILHGIPMALVAYLVSNLILHRPGTDMLSGDWLDKDDTGTIQITAVDIPAMSDNLLEQLVSAPALADDTALALEAPRQTSPQALEAAIPLVLGGLSLRKAADQVAHIGYVDTSTLGRKVRQAKGEA